MPQDKKEKSPSEYESSFILETDKSILEFLIAHIPLVDFAMVVGEEGNLKEFAYSKSFKGVIDLDEQKFLAKLVGLRFRIAEYHKIQGGLEISVDVFKDSCIAVTSRDSESMIAVVTKKTNIENVRRIMSQIMPNGPYGLTLENIVRVAVESALLEMGPLELEKVTTILKNEYRCSLGETIYHPEYLKKILLDLFGNSYEDILTTIHRILSKVKTKHPIVDYLEALKR